jgi:hypothetical protein
LPTKTTLVRLHKLAVQLDGPGLFGWQCCSGMQIDVLVKLALLLYSL